MKIPPISDLPWMALPDVTTTLPTTDANRCRERASPAAEV
jgi:hypothetical protein